MSKEANIVDGLLRAAASDAPPAGARQRALEAVGAAALPSAAGAAVGVKVFVAAAVGSLLLGGAAVHAIESRRDPIALPNDPIVAEEAKAPSPTKGPIESTPSLHSPPASASSPAAESVCAQVSLADARPEICSAQGTPTLLEIVNGCTAETVDLYWVDYECNEVFQRQLKPGETHIQGTYTAHPWRVRDHATRRLLKEIRRSGPPVAGGQQAIEKPAEIVVDGDATIPGTSACSEAGRSSNVRLTNKRSRPINVYWIDYDCTEVMKGGVPAGGIWLQRTQDAHRFRVRDALDHRLLYEWGGTADAGAREYVTIP